MNADELQARARQAVIRQHHDAYMEAITWCEDVLRAAAVIEQDEREAGRDGE